MKWKDKKGRKDRIFPLKGFSSSLAHSRKHMKGNGWSSTFLFSLLPGTRGSLGTLDFCSTRLCCHTVHEWTQIRQACCAWVNVEQGFSLNHAFVSWEVSSQIISSQPSALSASLIGTLSPSQCIQFYVSTFCCLIVWAACCVMKGQSSGKRGSWHGNKVLHISTYLPALKASEEKLVSHL